MVPEDKSMRFSLPTAHGNGFQEGLLHPSLPTEFRCCCPLYSRYKPSAEWVCAVRINTQKGSAGNLGLLSTWLLSLPSLIKPLQLLRDTSSCSCLNKGIHFSPPAAKLVHLNFEEVPFPCEVHRGSLWWYKWTGTVLRSHWTPQHQICTWQAMPTIKMAPWRVNIKCSWGMDTGRWSGMLPFNPVPAVGLIDDWIDILTFPCLCFPTYKLLVPSFWVIELGWHIKIVKVGCQAHTNYFIFSVFWNLGLFVLPFICLFLFNHTKWK